jgi:hypothetical protein
VVDDDAGPLAVRARRLRQVRSLRPR